MEELYIELCNKIASPHRNDTVLDLFRPPNTMRDKATQVAIGIPEDIVLLIGDLMHYKKMEDIPRQINDVSVKLWTNDASIVLKKPHTCIRLNKVGDELQICGIICSLGNGAKYETIVHRNSNSEQFFSHCFSMPGMRFTARYIPNDAHTDGKLAQYTVHEFGHYTAQVPRSNVAIHEDLDKMKYLRELIATSQFDDVCVKMHHENSVQSFSVDIYISHTRITSFNVCFCEQTNRVMHWCDPSMPKVKEALIDFFIELSTILNSPPT